MYTHAELAPGIYQFRYFDAPRGIGFNQYLIAAEQPAPVPSPESAGRSSG